MRVLVVDDAQDKSERIIKVVQEACAEHETPYIETATSVFDALALLRTGKPDIMVLDIALPLASGADANRTGGLEVVKEIKRRPAEYHMPGHIVGLTAFADVYDEVLPDFTSRMLTVTKYDPTSNEWELSLQEKIQFVRLAVDAEASHDFDLAIVCALDLELAPIKRFPWMWQKAAKPGDNTKYWTGQFQSGGSTRRVVAASVERKGMPSTIAVALKMIGPFRPRLMAMSGIAAGVKGKTEIGEVLIADPCWDWGSGKWSDNA